MKHILVAEDDTPLREGLVDALSAEGYRVTAVAEGAAAVTAWKSTAFDVVVLDVMMPELSGYEVCRTIRKKDTRLPIMMLTAKGEEIDKVVGLELGADDYMTKPFGLRELLARIHALLRRAGEPGTSGTPSPEAAFSFGVSIVRPKEFLVETDGQSQALTAREVKLLLIFAERPNEVLTRDELLNHAWGIDYYGTTRTLDQHIAQLRKKIEPNPSHPHYLVTVHGIGYRYKPSP